MQKDEVVKNLAEAFYAHDKSLYLVGGTVRDELLGVESHDIDCCTNALPEEIKAIAATTDPLYIVPIGEKFGTIRLIYPDEIIIEVTTYRTERYQDGSRKPVVTFGKSLLEDLSRRDFTMNAIAKSPITGDTIDPFYGVEHLAKGFIKAVGYPVDRFREDPLRMMRAIRFACTLHRRISEVYEIEVDTYLALCKDSNLIQNISQERIRDELNKILCSDRPHVGLAYLFATGLLHYILPELVETIGVRQNPYHLEDVFFHTLEVVKRVPAILKLRLTALLHDIAKSDTHTMDGEVDHFYEHEHVGAEMAESILHRLKYDGETIAYVQKMVDMHMRPHGYSSRWKDSTIRRFMVDAGPLVGDLLLLAEADIMSDMREPYKSEKLALLGEMIVRVSQMAGHFDVKKVQSPLNGDELMKLFGLPSGSWIKTVKDRLSNLVVEGDLHSGDKDKAARTAIDEFGYLLKKG